MIPVNVSLDEETHKLAKAKGRKFSAWVRDQLRSERNKREAWKKESTWYLCQACNKSSQWPATEKYPLCRNKNCTSTKNELVVIEE